MPRKPEPSFELKLIIWDVAATVGKDKPTDIQRQLDYELEKRRKEEGDFFEDAPDVRTITRIVEEINKLFPEVVVSKLPPHVWKLRDDYEAIKRLAEGSNQNSQSEVGEKQTGVTLERVNLARHHDEGIFEKSDDIMNERELKGFLDDVGTHRMFWNSKFQKLLKFLFFFEDESNKYVEPEIRSLCDRLCDAVFRFVRFLVWQDVELFTLDVNDTKVRVKLGPSFESLPPKTLREARRIIRASKDRRPKPHEQKLRGLTNAVSKAYKAYRAGVRETLSI